MRRFKTVIIEDELQCLETLELLIGKFCPEIEIVGTANSISDGKRVIIKEAPEVVFIDVELPGGNSFSLLKDLDKINFKVIFTTAHERYALQAAKSSAIDFLLKPINKEELIDAVSKLKNTVNFGNRINNFIENLNLPEDDHRIAIWGNKEIEFVNVAEIIYCKARANNAEIFLTNGSSILSTKPLKELEQVLSNYNFYRIHHANLINLKHVKKFLKIDGGFAQMIDGSQIEVSTRRKGDFLKKLKIN
ncbi:MAG: response regulator transcription factor [Bacteroidetes bacterium]|nr:response regulator transcription factor [Bacteroidota bacterium]HET6244967.1 LytTR family DNA-binding domain-containing protein [Bacteroidia bacterium]